MDLIVNGYNVKSGSAAVHFASDCGLPYVTVNFFNARLKSKTLRKLSRIAHSGSVIEFSFGDVIFAAFIEKMEPSSKKKYNFSLKSTGEIKYEQINKKD
jgi:hypothetical protein